MKKGEKLQVRFLGGFSAEYAGNDLAAGAQSTSQFVSLLQILLHHGDKGVSRAELKDVLFADREIDDVQHALRNTVYNAKRRLKAAGLPECEYIKVEKGVYYWADEVRPETDTDRMERYLRFAEEDDEERLEYLLKAIHLYHGEFLAGVSAIWAVKEGRHYREEFRSAVEEAADILRNQLKYRELLSLGEYASSVDPFAEWEALSIEALSAMGRYDEAADLYDDTMERYIKEHGTKNSTFIRELSGRLSSKMAHKSEGLADIQKKLTETEEDGRGGYLCSYPTFQEVYRTIVRMMARYADRIHLLLCTIVDSKGAPMREGAKLDELSARLQECLVRSVRRSDTVTKYGNAQFLVLLTNTSREDCDIVIKRIDRNYMQAGQRTGVEYVIGAAIEE